MSARRHFDGGNYANTMQEQAKAKNMDIPTVPVQQDVYVVDSDDEVARAIQFLLASAGISSRLFSSGRELTDVAAMSTPACVVMDAMLPDSSAVSLLNAFKNRGLDIPVIVLSSSNNISMAVTAVKSGAWDFFEKPYVQRVLLESVKRALQSHRNG